MTKAEARKKCIEARRAMTPEEVASKSREIVARLKGLPAFALASAFLCYVSSKDNEVDTLELIQWLLDNGRQVLVPVAGPHGDMVWSRLDAIEHLASGRFGILEPPLEHRRIVKPPHGSVVIVPGIAFSADCHRVGYGGGYFDRFLAAYGGIIIALAFHLQITSLLEAAAHDVPMDYVVTESCTYRRPGLERV